MTRPQEEYVAEGNHKLITQVAEYYNDTLKDIEFYQEVNSQALVDMSHEHLLQWKDRLRVLIFNGMNCTDKRSA